MLQSFVFPCFISLHLDMLFFLQACIEFNNGENEDQYKKASESYKSSLELFKV